MGLFDKLFSGSKEENSSKEDNNGNSLPWIELNALENLQEIEIKSNNKTQVIFKHSTRCGISRMVLKQFESEYNYSENDLDLYYLDLLKHRNISNEMASKFQVVHESPQILVIKKGGVVAFDSHSGVTRLDLSKFI